MNTSTPTEKTDYSNAPFLAVCPNYYGKGFSIEEAKSNMKASGGNLRAYMVFKLPEGATKVKLDDFGGIHWTWADDAPDLNAKCETVASRGLK